MAMLTVRNIEDDLKSRLRLRAGSHGHSMEEEVRQILREALVVEREQDGLGSRVHTRILALTGGGELALPARSAPRPAPDFGADGQ